MSSSFLSVLIQRQAGKYGDRVALRYRDYKTETWIPVSWNQFAATVKTVSKCIDRIRYRHTGKYSSFFSK